MSGPTYARLSLDGDKEALVSEKLRYSSYTPPRSPSRFSEVPTMSSTQSRGSFRSSVAQIPTPGTEEKRPPKFEPFALRLWVVLSGATIMIALAIALEIATHFSYNDNGFHVPRENKLPLVSTAFLTSFFPTAFIIPRFVAAYQSMRREHKLIAISTLTAMITYVWQPLAGSLFTIRQLPESSGFNATSTRVIGLSPTVADLSALAASAGFASASVYNNLTDPPFVQGGWAAAEFVFPENDYINGSVAVNTTAIQTKVNCAIPIALSLSTSNPTKFSVNATSVDGCELGPAFFNPQDAEQQYGVTNVPNCGDASANVTQQPVFFWYYHVRGNGSHEAKGVFCTPRIRLYDVMANADLTTGSLINTTIIDNYPTANNVSGSPLNGNAYNGTDVNVNARAISIKTSIPNAVYLSATNSENGVDSIFDDPNGFLDRTTSVYTQHLALAAKSIYFLKTEHEVPAVLTELAPRLWIAPIPAHVLSTTLVFVGILIICIHITHWRSRRDVYLTHAPGSIATVVSQTSRSGFGELLFPYDDEKRIRKKLEGLRFRLDQRTSAIVVDDRAVMFGGSSVPSTPDAREQSMMALIGQRHVKTDSRNGRSSVGGRYSDHAPPVRSGLSTPTPILESEHEDEERESGGKGASEMRTREGLNRQGSRWDMNAWCMSRASGLLARSTNVEGAADPPPTGARTSEANSRPDGLLDAIGARANTDDGDRVASQAEQDIDALDDNPEQPEQSGGGRVTGLLELIVSCINYCIPEKEKMREAYGLDAVAALEVAGVALAGGELPSEDRLQHRGGGGRDHEGKAKKEEGKESVYASEHFC
ncbi:hypothetical protein EW146_g7872 [Bondarzewia mesenterica]|uniref:Uncharacterized protein n=1 Tax=Bondarzewia mesenterica TaxID=1095465 RepID=A0A4S4LIT2_9AGAM|nr:hypothetical protein EW146_g7872 [Bondarzewia mesenterica]